MNIFYLFFQNLVLEKDINIASISISSLDLGTRTCKELSFCMVKEKEKESMSHR